MHMYFSWQWRRKFKYVDPPADWSIPDRPSDTGVRVRIKSVASRQYMTAPTGIGQNAPIYVKSGSPPLDVILVGSQQDGVFRVATAPRLFLSYTSITGALWLYDFGANPPTNYVLAHAGPGWSIKNTNWKQYMNLNTSTDTPYVNRNGNPSNPNSQWLIEGLPGN
jgi:hypothetical protein